MSEISLIDSEKKCREWFEKKKELNPKIVKRHISSFDEWMRGYDEDSEAFTERVVIYHYDDILFLQRNIRPDPYFAYILMNKKFVLGIYTNRRDFMIGGFNFEVQRTRI